MTERVPDETDAVALQAFVDGDADALNGLVNRYQKPLYGYFYAMTGNPADAQDLFQETWLRVIRNAHRFKNIHFKGWLMRIAHNALIDRHRRHRPVASLDVSSESASTWAENLPDSRPTPVGLMESAEIGAAILRAVETLPPDQREVFLLRSQTALSFDEIAQLQGVPLNTALGRMHYAVKRLRAELTSFRNEPDAGTPVTPGAIP